MESMRDLNRVMEREIEKGSCPLKFSHIEMGDSPYQFIREDEKLDEILAYLLRVLSSLQRKQYLTMFTWTWIFC